MHFIQFKSPVPTVKDGALGTYHDKLLIQRNWAKNQGPKNRVGFCIFYLFVFIF